MTLKNKGIERPINLLLHPLVYFHHIPLVEKDHKIHETLSDLKLFELYCWLEEKFLDKSDDLGLWDSNIPHFIFPHTHSAPEFVRRCQAWYMSNQRTIISPTEEILVTINAQTIEQMMQAPTTENATPFSQEELIEIYQKLDFSKRAQTLKLFMTENVPLQKKNPPFPSSIFPE